MRAPILSHAPRRVVVAPGAFKGTLSAATVAEAIATALRPGWPYADYALIPLADGGDGTVAALTAAGWRRQAVVTRGPLGVPAVASIARRADTAVVELASACGIALLPADRLAPMSSCTLGLADAVVAALAGDADTLVLGLGGSASTDGGAGLLVGLGARLLDGSGRLVRPCGATLASVASVDLSGLDRRLSARRLVAATDVGSPLLGPRGASAVFGPQKGATPAEVAALERGLASWARVLAAASGADVADVPGAGAAGGTGAAALALRARVVSGAQFVHDAVRLADRIAGADLVLTGEGRLDETSLLGKGVGEVARLGRAAGVPVVAVCGQVALDADAARAAGFAATVDVSAFARNPSTRDPVRALTDAVAHAVAW